jgi:hypothetical protein
MKKLIAIALIALFVTGCGRVTVPPAAKGKILSSAGYSVDVKETGKYWLTWWESMVILDTSTQVMSENISVKMADDLELGFNVRFRTRINGSERVINAMFNDITHDNYTVSLNKVYGVYGRDVVQSTARSVVGKYKVAEVSKNFDRITKELQAELVKQMANSPLEVSNVTLGGMQYPKVIVEAIEKQQERELAIQTEANDQAVKLVQKENELALAQADYEIRMTRAKAIRDENKMTAEGLNPVLIQYRQLEVLEKMAENKNAVFVPYESLSNVGVQNRMFTK